MSDRDNAEQNRTVFRVDKFIVPANSLPRFTEGMLKIQQAVRTLPGCVRDIVLTQFEGTGTFNVVHIVEWDSELSLSRAQQVMQKKFSADGFDPKLFFVDELKAVADMGLYHEA